MLDVVVRTAIQEMEIEADIKNIHDAIYTKERGVSRVPALFINNKLLVEGRVPTVTEMKGIIKDAMLDPSYQ
jgi:predicted DsbA family dithiol-disulfide isomerase